ncbi:MAG: flagellar basal body-associated FliL family protein [Alphaproteobacteria bacterium]|nr:flagellar basal body-associated FliL family protein [Alphaproteobacteria bacterium]MBO4644365.1 flagellar basal body-associated FliL family protein [Alphaproteobacteria bacterium]
MAEENEEQQPLPENENQPQTVAPKKKILLLLLPIFLVVGTVIGLYFSGIADSFLAVDASKEPEKASSEEKQVNSSSIFFDVPEILVNLSVKPGQKPIYFKIKVALEMNSAADSEQAEKMLPRIVDSLQFYLREMRLEEIQGSVGTYRLKEEINSRLNRILAPIKVNDVLFKEILIQ